MRAIVVLLAMMATTAFARDHVVRGPNGQRYHTGLIYEPNRPTTGLTYFSPKVSGMQLPAEYDSRTEGFVPPVKDQGNCGSCWAFSMTRAYEGAILLGNHGVYNDLSEQDWVSHDFGGCGGGNMDASYAIEQGLLKEADCPYQARTNVRCNDGPKQKAVRWGFIGARNRTPTVEELKAAIYQYKILSVDVAAGGGFGSPNSDGVITGCGARSINHMVTLIGWREVDGDTQFLVSNSWGTDWGMDGYAWSKQGCNTLASTSESALYIVAEEGPAPVPPTVQLPVEVSINQGSSVLLGVLSEPGVSYSWSDGTATVGTNATVIVTPTADATYTLTATSTAGTAQSSVHVKVLASPLPVQ